MKHCYPAPLQYISRYALKHGVADFLGMVADFVWNGGRFPLECRPIWLGIRTVNAQEFRRPDEIKDIVIKSTYPVRLAFVMTPEDNLYVWVGFKPVYKTTKEKGYHYAGFLTDKLNIYENGLLVRQISKLKEMPEPRSVKSASIGFDLELFPRTSEDRANTIVLSSASGSALPGLGFKKNETTLGPFPYQINILWSRVQADKGLIYVKANCGNTYDKVEKNGEVDPFSVLFTLDHICPVKTANIAVGLDIADDQALTHLA